MAKKKSNNFLKNAYRSVVGWKWFWVVGNLSLAALIVVALIYGSQELLDRGTRHGEEIKVPEFVGMSYADAVSAAKDAGLRLEVVDSVYAKKGRGLVREQNPTAGSMVKEGRRVLITMNALGVRKVPVPYLVGYSTRQALAELSSRGLVLGKIIYVDDIATNNVLNQRYRGKDIAKGTEVEAESSIDLVVGLNPSNSQTMIPSVRGKRASEAARHLNDYYLNVRSIQYDSSVKTYEDSLKAVVYKQSPDSSRFSVKMGTEITLYLKVPTSDE